MERFCFSEGQWKVEMNVEVIASKVPSLQKTSKTQDHAANIGHLLFMYVNGKSGKAIRLKSQFLQIYDP